MLRISLKKSAKSLDRADILCILSRTIEFNISNSTFKSWVKSSKLEFKS